LKETLSITNSTLSKQAAARVGHIEYLNCLPLYYGLESKGFLPKIKLINGKPTELSKMLLEGQLDIAPIPSIEYGRHFKKLKLLSDISISSDGEVKSILLVSKYPIDMLDKKTICLTSASATSQVLLKLILSLKYHQKPGYVQSSDSYDRALKDFDAALVIGDEALDLYYHKLKGIYKYDLGKEYKELTGEKMVFAVWAVRNEFADKNPELTKALDQAFGHSIAYSKKCLCEVAHYGAKRHLLDKDILKSYFDALRFDFNKEYQKGLMCYYQKAVDQGYLKELPTLNFC